MPKTAVMLRLDDEDLAKLDAAANVLSRTRANVVLLALRDYLDMVDKAHTPSILDAEMEPLSVPRETSPRVEKPLPPAPKNALRGRVTEPLVEPDLVPPAQIAALKESIAATGTAPRVDPGTCAHKWRDRNNSCFACGDTL